MGDRKEISFWIAIKTWNSFPSSHDYCHLLSYLLRKQGSHRLEKYLNLDAFLEKSLKIKSALKSTGKSLKSLEKSLNSTIFCRTKHYLNQHKIAVPLFGALYAAPNKGTTILY